jgi:hypothetical protein
MGTITQNMEACRDMWRVNVIEHCLGARPTNRYVLERKGPAFARWPFSELRLGKREGR